MLIDQLQKAIKDIDRFAASATQIGPLKAAERIITELQYAGPAWSGQFGNSWQIEGPQGQAARGTGAAGQLQPVKFTQGPFTGRQAFSTAFRTALSTNKIVFTISNFSSHADEARDLKESVYIDPRISPIKPIERGERRSGIRGDLSVDGTGPNRRTAPLDWYATYLRGGGLDRAVKIEMDTELGRI
jgi:hypothetical protein